MDAILGMVYLFAGNFVPEGYASCDGQLVGIEQNTPLFSLLGTMYGGDGRTNFGLPKIAAPAAEMRYVIATRGVFPSRS
jgi:microcystin-dependent protein